MNRRRNGFTLIELLIVIIIVAILASVAVPMMHSSARRAIASEAIAALGAIKNALKLYHLENNHYTMDLSELNFGYRGHHDPYGTSGLDGTYFGQECYDDEINFGAPGHEFIIYCRVDMNSNSAPKKDEVANWNTTDDEGPYIRMDDQGRIETNIVGLSY